MKYDGFTRSFLVDTALQTDGEIIFGRLYTVRITGVLQTNPTQTKTMYVPINVLSLCDLNLLTLTQTISTSTYYLGSGPIEFSAALATTYDNCAVQYDFF